MEKQTAVSGIQASGKLHIGNYIGAIKQFVELQDKYKMFAFVADLHAITVPQDPQELRKNTLDAAAIYLACELDPKKATLFIQSHIQEHVELGWILNTMTPLGELERMTQFKEKKESQGQKQGVHAGLLNYPTLMAADILIYRPDTVPVGEDQLQHLELTRTLARKFNSRFGETFKEPRALLKKEGAKIMGLDDPSKKMSKSSLNPNNYIELLDQEAEIRRKIQIAVTDSGKEIKFNPEEKPAVSNLLTIFSLMSGKEIKTLEKEYGGKNYAEFKKDLGNLLIEKLTPIQIAYKKIIKDEKKLLKILADGAKSARAIAQETMKEVKTKIGLL
ncbi:MAG: tryptophan--tRNA ligase [Patescibacteria group bacterium]